MKQEIRDIKLTYEQTERRVQEERESEERKHTEEVTFLKKTNAQLKVKQSSWKSAIPFWDLIFSFIFQSFQSQLEGIIAPKK